MDPRVDFFVKFHEINPNAQGQCIYFVKELRLDRRCKGKCFDNERATELHRIIIECKSENINVDHIKDYIRFNCCTKAGHRDLVLSSPLLIPLVERWLDEILMQKHLEDALRESTQSPTPTTPKQNSPADSRAPSSCDTSASLATSRATTIETPSSSPPYSRSNSLKLSIVSSVPLQLDASPTPLPRVSSTITPSTTPSESEPSKAQKRYDLRPRAVNESLAELSRQVSLTLLAPFHPHINEPTSEDTVAWKFCQDLNKRKRDFSSGSVYIYSRESSPGYVKIGWTSKSVDDRLKEWSECGYTPIEVYRMTGVPYAQRVETLTHYELIKEWRREQPCRGCQTRKQKHVRHQEWFQVSQETAKQVLSKWAELFKEASPYEQNGTIKSEWRNVMDVLKVESKLITSEMLLKHHKATIVKEIALAK